MSREEFINEFKKRIYDPYTEAWTLMKQLRDSDYTQDAWDEYLKQCESFLSKHPTEIGNSIYRVLLDCGSEVGRIVRPH